MSVFIGLFALTSESGWQRGGGEGNSTKLGFILLKNTVDKIKLWVLKITLWLKLYDPVGDSNTLNTRCGFSPFLSYKPNYTPYNHRPALAGRTVIDSCMWFPLSPPWQAEQRFDSRGKGAAQRCPLRRWGLQSEGPRQQAAAVLSPHPGSPRSECTQCSFVWIDYSGPLQVSIKWSKLCQLTDASLSQRPGAPRPRLWVCVPQYRGLSVFLLCLL